MEKNNLMKLIRELNFFVLSEDNFTFDDKNNIIGGYVLKNLTILIISKEDNKNIYKDLNEIKDIKNEDVLFIANNLTDEKFIIKLEDLKDYEITKKCNSFKIIFQLNNRKKYSILV